MFPLSNIIRILSQTITENHISLIHFIHLSLPCNLHFLRILYIIGQKDESNVMIKLLGQKSEPNKIVIIKFVAAAVRN